MLKLNEDRNYWWLLTTHPGKRNTHIGEELCPWLVAVDRSGYDTPKYATLTSELFWVEGILKFCICLKGEPLKRTQLSSTPPLGASELLLERRGQHHTGTDFVPNYHTSPFYSPKGPFIFPESHLLSQKYPFSASLSPTKLGIQTTNPNHSFDLLITGWAVHVNKLVFTVPLLICLLSV